MEGRRRRITVFWNFFFFRGRSFTRSTVWRRGLGVRVHSRRERSIISSVYVRWKECCLERLRRGRVEQRTIGARITGKGTSDCGGKYDESVVVTVVGVVLELFAVAVVVVVVVVVAAGGSVDGVPVRDISVGNGTLEDMTISI